ncbi:MAG: Hpt domain-containing protein [Spirochaetales bacterium]|nr:Hpt domain-containing protein [Spirochaetales bacterium]
MDEETLIDQQLVYNITDGSRELFDQMMELFEEISPEQITRIFDSYGSGDYQSLRAAAHDVKSSASSIGAVILYESALKLEQSAKMKLELKEILPMIKDVEEKVKETISYYRDGKISFGNGSV